MSLIKCSFSIRIKQRNNSFVLIKYWLWRCHQSRWWWSGWWITDSVNILRTYSKLITFTKLQISNFAHRLRNVIIKLKLISIRNLFDHLLSLSFYEFQSFKILRSEHCAFESWKLLTSVQSFSGNSRISITYVTWGYRGGALLVGIHESVR